MKLLFFLLILISSETYAQQIPFAFQKSTTSSPSPIDPISVNWGLRPQHFQLFQRESNDSADIETSGELNAEGYDSVKTKVYRNNSLVKTSTLPLFYSGSTALFGIVNKIKAELAEYKIEVLFVTNLGDDSLEYTADSLVAGDVYIIAGQSNAQASDTLVTFQDQYCRTFGIQTGNTNQNAYSAGDTLWHQSFGGYNGFVSLNNFQPYNVGVWGITLQKKIRDSLGIPTAIINGALHSTKIYQHQRSTSLSTIYGKLLYRMEKSGLQHKVKALFWYQGEANVDSSTTYASQFNSLYNSWKSDFTALNKIYVMQTRPLGCAGEGVAGELREVQRQLPVTYSDVQLISTMGVPGYVSGAPSSFCHYEYTGYQWLANAIYPTLVGQYYGGVTDTSDSRPPNLTKAFYKSTSKDTICLVFGSSNLAGIPADSLSRSIKKYFFLNGVAGYTSGIFGTPTLSSGGDTLYLALNSASTASRISYIPPKWDSTGATVYAGPTFRNPKGIGALTFNNVVIFEAESIAFFNRIATAGSPGLSVARQVLCDSLIKRGKTNGWYTGDVLHIYANSDTVASLTNWLGSNHNGSRRGKALASFTADRGFTFSKTDSGYIYTGIIPDMLTYFKQDSGSIATYRYTNSIDTFGTANDHRLFGASTFGGSYLGILPKSYFSGAFRFLTNVNDVNTALTVSNPVAFGVMMSVRRSADTVKGYEEGIEIYSKTNQSPTFANGFNDVVVGAYNEDGTIRFFLNGRATMFYIGNKHSAARVSSFNADIEWYLLQVGASYTQ